MKTFWVFMFFLHSVEQIFLEEQFPFNFFCTFLRQEKTKKPENPENLKTQKLIQKTHSV